MKEKIINIIVSSLRELTVEEIPGLEDLTSNTRIYGGAKGNLDSVGLVHLICDIEERIEKSFGENISLTDERAMSQRRSPFATVGRLADYIVGLLKDNGNK